MITERLQGDEPVTTKCIHEVFEEQAFRTPEAIALRSDSRQLTYRTLNELANQLGRNLKKYGLDREVVAGVFMEPSLYPAIAAIAIIKAGGACLPVPPRYPDHQIRGMLRDCDARFVLTTTRLSERIPHEGIRVICAEAEEWREESTSSVGAHVTLDNAAFIRFTSGTTGSPKCVVNLHRSLVYRMGSASVNDMKAGDTCALNTSAGLGIRLMTPLACGATVAIAGDEETRDPAKVAAFLARHEVTSAYVAPSFLNELLELKEACLTPLEKLRVIGVGGEFLHPGLAIRFKQRLPHVYLTNLYGCSETGGVAAMQTLREGSAGVMLPAADTTIHILDEQMRPQTPGVTGEIYVGSLHLARGYLHRPELTAERFVADPFRPGGRLYRTGDAGRQSEGGGLEFFGRVDDQIKIRGFRVEPAEVEAAILRAPEVKDAAVAAYKIDRDKRLVGWVVARPGANLSFKRLRRFLMEQLPTHMVPSVFLEIESLPLTPRGKIDRNALPAPSVRRPDSESSFQLPRTTTEETIAGIWRDVLQVDLVSVHDHLLDLGGDSLTAYRILARVHDMFEVELSLEALFDQFTVAVIAAEIEMLTEAEQE